MDRLSTTYHLASLKISNSFNIMCKNKAIVLDRPKNAHAPGDIKLLQCQCYCSASTDIAADDRYQTQQK